jgi:UDP-N-acetylglucosamine 2-epimerase
MHPRHHPPRRNTDEPTRLVAILTALSQAPLPVLVPMHPCTRARIAEQGLQALLRSFTPYELLGFLAMVLLERQAALVVTDLGGVQKEAFPQGTPCVTVRRETEWVELVECGWNRLADPADTADMLDAMQQQLGLDPNQPRPQLYGDGYAAEAILARLQPGVDTP